MTLTSIIDPALMDELNAQGHFPNTGTVQDFTEVMVEGDADLTWANVAGLIDLPCAVAALTAKEIEELDKTIGESTHKARLIDYYDASTIKSKMRFVSDGVTYEITGTDSDQHDTMTRLFLKVITL